MVGRQTLEMEVTPGTLCDGHRAGPYVRLRVGAGSDARHGPDPWRDPRFSRVFQPGRRHEPGGLRFPDECCRHKVLDLIGDLALIGKPLLGHVIAERAGHAMHAALVARIMSDPTLYEVLSFDQLATRVAHALVS